MEESEIIKSMKDQDVVDDNYDQEGQEYTNWTFSFFLLNKTLEKVNDGYECIEVKPYIKKLMHCTDKKLKSIY